MNLSPTSQSGSFPQAQPPLPLWRELLKQAIRDPQELGEILRLPTNLVEKALNSLTQSQSPFPLLVPRGYVERMKPGDPHDPLLRQVFPLEQELTSPPEFVSDPVGDSSARLSAGLLQKYSGRALLITTGSCAVHCRYCFRRHYPYVEDPKSLSAWEEPLRHLAADPTIHEVLLSGGDPWMLSDSFLARLVHRLDDIPHLSRLRIHTRMPIVLPERVCEELLTWLGKTRLTPLVVVHANHPAELNQPVEDALGNLIDSGIPVMNQAVLLRGVNDSAEVLVELCERLANLRVLPYYLHQLDKVAGGAHFEVPQQEGLELMRVLRTRLPGYAVPRYVQEVAGEKSKVPLY